MADYPDYEGQKSKLFSVADWSALEATDKNFLAQGLGIAFGVGIFASYTVPAGKTLYITGAAGSSQPGAAADYDHFLWTRLYLYNNTTGVILANKGSPGGGELTLTKPIVIDASEELYVILDSYANVAVTLVVTAWGYEL